VNFFSKNKHFLGHGSGGPRSPCQNTADPAKCDECMKKARPQAEQCERKVAKDNGGTLQTYGSIKIKLKKNVFQAPAPSTPAAASKTKPPARRQFRPTTAPVQLRHVYILVSFLRIFCNFIYF
jgi:hypothetical protein